MRVQTGTHATRKVGDATVTLLSQLRTGGWIVGDRTGRIAYFAQGDWCWSMQPPMPIRDVAKAYFARSFTHLGTSQLGAVVSGPGVYAFDVRTGEVSWSRRLPFFWGFFPSRPVAVAEAMGCELWVSYDDGKIEVLAADGHRLAKLYDGLSPFQMFPVGDGSCLVGSSGYGIGLWDAHTRKRVWHEPRRERILCIANARAARCLALLTLEYIELLDLDSRISVRHEWAGGLPALAVSTDGKRIAAGAHGGLYLCEVGRESPVFVEIECGKVTSLAFDHSSDQLLYGTSTGIVGTVRIEADP
ncbi:MAG: hypothetical protein IT207_00635 [Fimbriimonadaceae bacterium]|nr:hypothetical protein [Fimbriimonadaceae bacterium]